MLAALFGATFATGSVIVMVLDWVRHPEV